MLGDLIRRLLRRPAEPATANGSSADAGIDDRIRAAMRLREEGRNGEAVDACLALLARTPDNPDALHVMASAYFGQGKQQQGIASLRRVCELEPRVAKYQANLAGAFAATGDPGNAIASYRRAVELDPEFTQAWNPLALLLKALGRYDEAEACCRSALQGRDSADIHHVLGNVLFEQGRVEEGIAEIRAALHANPDMPETHSDLARMLNYIPVEPLVRYREHKAWADRYARPLEQAAPPHSNAPDPQRRLRVGYVSPYFRKHAVTFFLEPVVEHHDRERIEIFLYADLAQPDEYSRRLQSYGAVWRKTVGMTDERLAALVREDAIDILVDLSGQTPGHRLLAFARRPAPIQVTWSGYPNTTGMDSMDYRITDAYCDPPGTTEHLHSETLMRLPGIYMAWRPPDEAPDVGSLPAIETGAATFGSFNSCYKVTPTIVAVWSRILQRLPGSRLILFAYTGEVAGKRARQLFETQGIAPERLLILPRMTYEEFLAAHRQVDIALDTFPYHGTTTTCSCLWMGLPVVVLEGTVHVSRVGVSLLSNLGLQRMVASSVEEYVEIAVSLAADTAGLAALRADLRDRMLRSPNTDGAACTAHLEHAFRERWRRWCNAGERRPQSAER